MSKTTPPPSFTEAELKTHLAKCRVVILGALNTSRSIRKFVMQFGGKADSILTVPSFEQAKVELEKEPTHILITELTIENQSGLELIAHQESRFKNRLEIATLIVSGDPSSADSGMIMETSADALLVKPFNFDTFKTAFFQALANKVKPTPFWQLLETGKEQLKAEKYAEAMKCFEASMAHHPTPTLSWHYLAEVHRLQKQVPEAIHALESGLKLDAKDYRCLYALFDIHMAAGTYSTAYTVAKRIHEHYPVSATRILDLVKLSVYSRKFEDLTDYCQIFKNLEVKTPVLSRTVIAAMLVCSKHFHLKGDSDRCRDSLRESSRLALDTGLLQLEVLRYMIETSNFQEAEQFVNLLPEKAQKSPEVRLLALELAYAAKDFGEVALLGANLLKEPETKVARVYELLIECSAKLGRSAEVLQRLQDEAQTLFPDRFKPSKAA